jgi:hypothetical protein
MGFLSRYVKYPMVMLKIETADTKIQYRTYGPETLTVAFQVLLVYSIIMLFPVPHKSLSGLCDLSILASLHELGFYISEKGLVQSSRNSTCTTALAREDSNKL